MKQNYIYNFSSEYMHLNIIIHLNYLLNYSTELLLLIKKVTWYDTIGEGQIMMYLFQYLTH